MDRIYFTINGDKYSLVGSKVSPDTSLNDYIRHHVNLRGTKAMCQEGGCGACVVSVTQTHPESKEKHTFAVNSCLVHILSCHEWDIITIEGIGNKREGYHEIQTRLASFNGTQCGFCTPGWIMNMYCIYEESSHKLKSKQVENSFGGNMCRCTGYRPILDAFKSLTTDANEDLKDKIQDMEDLANITCLSKKNAKSCLKEDDWCLINHANNNEAFCLNTGASKWYKAYKINDVFNILGKEGTNSYRFVAGNTGKGVFPIKEEPRILIDISSIEILKESTIDVNLILGAGMTLTDVMKTFQEISRNSDFSYLTYLNDHLDLVAHVPVRNIGTIGGNLAMKNKHQEFASDIFLLFTTLQASLTLVTKYTEKKEMDMIKFLQEDLTDKLITNVKLPPLSSKYFLRTYKIMPRAQNAHAIMHGGFLYKLNNDKVESANIVYGCINADFVTASKTSNYVTGKDLFQNQILQASLKILNSELTPNEMPPEPSPFCRRMIALGLFYKSIINLAPDSKINPRYKSGGTMFNRPLSKGTQTFETDKSLWPLNKPIPKLEALIQCSGEASYTNDKGTLPREVHVAYVLSGICKGDIDSFDATEALKLPGVVGFFSSKDIPGKNTFTPVTVVWQESEEEILAQNQVSYFGQPIGLIAAVTEKLANKAAEMVKVKYKNVQSKIVLTVQEALAAPASENRVRQDADIKPTNQGTDVTKVIKGSYNTGSQYHYTMEPQVCIVEPKDGCYDVTCSTQWMDLVHVAVATCLNIPENMVNVTVPRLGGGYGGKASRSAQTATACAVVAHALNRTARMPLSLQANMQAVGKRQACFAEYEIGINDDGIIQYVNLKYYSDCGYSFNDSSGGELVGTLTNLYDTTRWHITGYSVITDKASNTWCRGPATTEATAILEHIMERIAYSVSKDSAEIKILNLAEKHLAVRDMILSFKSDCEFNKRSDDIKKFNNENCWRKRAIKLSTMSYPIGYSGNFAVTVSVYHADGSVAVSHAGIEMGQGINTKVGQVCAHALNIPLEKIAIKPPNNMVTPNAMATNGSITSECLAFATMRACNELLTRLRPVRDELTDPTWEEVVKMAYDKGINLQSSYMMSQNDGLKGYSVYGVTIMELELDVLTGTHQILRVDLLEDTGQSMSPEIDVGQIEGAFMMGIGLWTSEHLVYDKETGRLLTDRTWTYKPPGVKDIPVDFRVTFKRNSFNPAGVLRSKATGEPALVMSVVVTHALHAAILEARREYGYDVTEWLHVENPYTVDNIMQAISPKIEKFLLQ